MEGNGFLTKDRIRAAKDIQVEELFIPEWGDKVLVCSLTAAGKSQYQSSLVEISANGQNRKLRMENAAVKLVIRCVIDPEAWKQGDKKLWFSESDAEWLGTKSAAAIERIVEVANRLSAMTKEENEAILKNSEATQSDSSPSLSL